MECVDTFKHDDVRMRLEVLPYGRWGFVFHWRLDEATDAAPPISFTVQMSPTPAGPWEDLSSPTIDLYWLATEAQVRTGKTTSRNYRVVAVDHKGRRFSSPPVIPCSDLSRSEFLLAHEILRKEELNSRTFAAVAGEAWISAEFGTKCTKCLDPITGDVRNSHCSQCHGTGFFPSHYGPFKMWLQFSSKQNHGAEHDSVGGTKDDQHFQVRAIGTPQLKKNDLIRDKSTGKMYYINSVTNAAEIRRVPIVQSLVVSEAISTDQCYDIVERPNIGGCNA